MILKYDNVLMQLYGISPEMLTPTSMVFLEGWISTYQNYVHDITIESSIKMPKIAIQKYYLVELAEAKKCLLSSLSETTSTEFKERISAVLEEYIKFIDDELEKEAIGNATQVDTKNIKIKLDNN